MPGVQYAAGQPGRQRCHQIRAVHAKRDDRAIHAGNLMRQDRPVGGVHRPLGDRGGAPGDRIGDAELCNIRMVLGKSLTPAPTSPISAACSYTLTSVPADRSASAADRPPMPPPTITTRTDGICINPIAVSAWQGSTRYLRPP